MTLLLRAFNPSQFDLFNREKQNMKNIIAAVLICCASIANAGQYFRIMDPSHPQQVVGAFVDPLGVSNTSVGTAYAVFTHSVKDGCWLPSVGCVDWSPLLVGGSVKSGRFSFDIGTGLNLTPAIKMGAWHMLTLVTKEDAFVALKGLLSSQPVSGPDLSLAIGPALAVTPIDHGIILPINKWTGRARIFAGPQLKF